MLKIKFRNVDIIAPNHDDLLRSEVTLALKNIKDVFDTAEHALKHNPPATVCYSVTRLNKSDKLIAAYVPSASKNPYLFLFDSKTKELTETIPFEILSTLKNEYVVAELKANVRDIDNVRFKSLKTDNLTAQVIRMAKLR